MARRSRAREVAIVTVLTVRCDEVQRTSRVRFDAPQRVEICQNRVRKTLSGIASPTRVTPPSQVILAYRTDACNTSRLSGVPNFVGLTRLPRLGKAA